MEEEKQVIEVDYDKDLVEDYKQNYIMEEEGIGALDEEPYDAQDNFSEVPFEEMNDPNEVILEEVELDD